MRLHSAQASTTKLQRRWMLQSEEVEELLGHQLRPTGSRSERMWSETARATTRALDLFKFAPLSAGDGVDEEG